MNEQKKKGFRFEKLRGSRATIALFVAAAVLLLGSVMGSTRAALTYYSENYSAEIQMYDIGVTLMENGTAVSTRDYSGSDDQWEEGGEMQLLAHMLDSTDQKLLVGKRYPEELRVQNSGNIDEYVRVIVYRYWVDESGKKTDVSPELIQLDLTENGWILDEKASTPERMVLYYNQILPEGQTSEAFADGLTIDTAIKKNVTQTTVTEGNKTTITTSFNYKGLEFRLETEVDAEQTHNAEDAIKSAWGVDAAVGEDGSLSLR